MINVNNLKPGITFSENNDIFTVLSAQHSKQGRGQASVKVKVKNLRNGSIIIKSYTGGDKVSSAHIDKKNMTYLYNDGEIAVLMDQNTFDQFEIPMKNLDWEKNFLKDGNSVLVRSFDKEILDIELPTNISLKVESAPDAIKGNTQNNPSKKIILETGFEIDAPMFIKKNEIVVVSTETGKYIGRG